MLEIIKFITGMPPDLAALGTLLLLLNIYNNLRAQYRERMIMTVISTELMDKRTHKPLIPLQKWHDLGLLDEKYVP